MSDEVGYKSPPKHSRFQKGRSGNPSGRPKRPRALHDDLLAELAAQVVLTEGGRSKRVTKQQVVVKALIAAAAKGNARAAALIMPWRERGEAAVVDTSRPTPITLEDQKLLDAYVARELGKRRARERVDAFFRGTLTSRLNRPASG